MQTHNLNKSTLVRRFAHCLKLGTGEAYIIARDNPGLNISKEVLRAACHNDAYDPQSEGSRARYVYSIIKLLPEGEQILYQVFKRLLVERSGDHDTEQMFEVARLAALDGNAKARTVIYKRYQKNSLKGYEYAGEYSIIALDGFEGLLRVADVRGRMLCVDTYDWEDNLAIRYFQDDNPRIKVMARLKNAAKLNPNIAAYLGAIEENNELRSHNKNVATVYAYDSVKQLIGSNKRLVLIRAARELSDGDVEKLATDMLAERQRKTLEMYLRVFSERKFPFGHQKILELCRRPDNHQDRLKYFAIEALSFFEHREVRAFFLENFAAKGGYDYLPLLELNYRKGDHLIITDLIEKARSQDVIHSMVFGLIDIYQANPTKACKKPLLAMYDKLNCGLHREDILKILYQNGVLPDKILREAVYDSDDETVKWAQGVLDT